MITEMNGNLIIWNGHLCEGDYLACDTAGTFCLWTRCGECDVPANAGYEGDLKDVTCQECKELAR